MAIDIYFVEQENIIMLRKIKPRDKRRGAQGLEQKSKEQAKQQTKEPKKKAKKWKQENWGKLYHGGNTLEEPTIVLTSEETVLFKIIKKLKMMKTGTFLNKRMARSVCTVNVP